MPKGYLDEHQITQWEAFLNIKSDRLQPDEYKMI